MRKMRTVGAAALLLCALAFLHRPAIAEEACGPEKIGLSRTVTIDTSGSTHLGSHYRSGKTKPLLADGEVVLTFDDGPSRANTRSVLETLAAHCTKATFFMVGRMALADPEMVKEVAARGHTVGTHTWSHARLDNIADDKALAEIELGFSAVQQALGKPISPFFRFPYLRDSTYALGLLDSRKIAAVSIDIDSRDFELRDPAALHARVIADVTSRRKGIILFHDIHAWTARALPLILADLKSLGFRVVHLAPKTGVETLPEYDKVAEQELIRRRLVMARNPLAKRAIGWPVAGMKAAKVDAKDAKETKVQEGAAPSTTAPDATPAPPAPPAPKDDWAADLWKGTN